jgi:hypothetical protein
MRLQPWQVMRDSACPSLCIDIVPPLPSRRPKGDAQPPCSPHESANIADPKPFRSPKKFLPVPSSSTTFPLKRSPHQEMVQPKTKPEPTATPFPSTTTYRLTSRSDPAHMQPGTSSKTTDKTRVHAHITPTAWKSTVRSSIHLVKHTPEVMLTWIRQWASA